MNKSIEFLIAMSIGLGAMVGCDASTSAKPAATAQDKPVTAGQMKSLAPGVYTIPDSHEVKLTYIPSGKFVMGSPANELGRRADETQRTVTISKPFYLGIKEITQAQYINAMHPGHVEDRINRGPWAHHLPAFYKGGPWGAEKTKVDAARRSDKPMDMLTWEEATAYCAWLTKREAAAGRLPKGYVYRLPTEAEWEYACRAGSKGPFGVQGERASFMDLKADIFDGTTSNPVGRRVANPWGLYDMHGSLWEWVVDSYGPYDASKTTDPVAIIPEAEKVMRGGSYMSHKPGEDKDKVTDAYTLSSIRSASRKHLPADYDLPVTGLRIALAPKLK
jgi:formylglycine-generating enzyme required for sulfatase activity